MEKDLDKKMYDEFMKGNKDSFEFLYNKYEKRIEYFIYNIVKDTQKAEDLTQDTFIYVMQNKMKENTSFKYYIYLVAKSKAFNYINVGKRRNEINETYLLNNDEQVEKDVLDVILKEENKKELLESIDLLDEKYKNAIYLVNIEGLSYNETAKILGQTLSNTKSLIHRGKRQLRNILLKKGFKDMNKIVKVMFIIISITAITSGMVYATSIIYEKIKSYYQEENVTEPITNSEAPVGEIVYKNFKVEENEKNIINNDWKDTTIDSEKLYFKKVTDYSEYKELMNKCSNLRKLNENDFDNYFAVVVLSENINNFLKYNFITYDYLETDENLNLVISCNIQTDNNNSGLVVIMTKRHLDYIIKLKSKN